MQKIVPHLWFDKEAKEAAEFYVATFGGDSAVTNVTTLKDTPSGDADTVSFRLRGYEFMAISAGPLFTFNPSISFAVACDTVEDVTALWEKLSEGGKVLMSLDAYPFSEKYGWLQDKYGLSWQIMKSDQPGGQPITPTLMFVGEVCGKTEEAVTFYGEVFKENAQIGTATRYEEGEAPDKPGTVKYLDFTLFGQQFAAMDSARMHDFSFNEAISLMVNCDDQAEIDDYWSRLSAVPEAEQCGWLKDKYGVSWQIVPSEMNSMMTTATPEQLQRVTQAFLPMKKFDIQALRDAYEGK